MHSLLSVSINGMGIGTSAVLVNTFTWFEILFYTCDSTAWMSLHALYAWLRESKPTKLKPIVLTK